MEKVIRSRWIYVSEMVDPSPVLVTSIRTGKASFSSSRWVMTIIFLKSSWIECMSTASQAFSLYKI